MLSRIRRSMVDKDQGFTLIELLVVVIVIGLLAAIAIPSFLSQRKKSVDASLKSDLHHAAAIMKAWAVDHPGAASGTVSVTAAAPATGPLTGLKIGPDNKVWLKASPATVGAWCLYATNPNASKATEMGGYMVWRSLLGGLDPTISAVGGTDCV